MKRWVENIISIPLWLVTWPRVSTHYDRVKGNLYVKKLKRATYKEIKQKMLSVEWEFDANYPNSLFDSKDYYNNYFHASIFRFGDVGYLLTPYGYIMASRLQSKIAKSLPSYQKHLKPYV